MNRAIPYFLLLCIAALACDVAKEEAAPELFEKQKPETTGVSFINELTQTEAFNIYTYRNFFNGGGVGIGDIDNDGLKDIYFTGNQVKNRLYRNLGEMKFEDITDKAGVAGNRAWSTGVAMADINGDGFLDIYVCNSGDVVGDNKQNELFINNGDGTFTEQAEAYGLADSGFSTHAAFFDYDRDGDLDVYLLNNSYKAIGSFNLQKNERPIRDAVGGDKLYRNDGGKFVDVSSEAGIYGSVIGFGLGVTVGDVNNDHWLDIFISNDFFEKDYLYINQQDGTFKEVLEERMQSISAASMGADMADINNDAKPDIFVTDMLPEPDERLKQVTTFESWDRHHYGVENGYHYQYSRNMLHLNNGDGTYAEVGRLAGIEATDWSWGALFFDMDNDGYKDLFVANGIYQDITDLDYLNFIDSDQAKQEITKEGKANYQQLLDPIPINPISNYAYKNMGNLKFENRADAWGLGTPVHSNGSVFVDLDNDGDLDLVVNNVNAVAHIYKNKTNELLPENRYLKLKLKGKEGNLAAFGTKITAKVGESTFYLEQMPTRGFQSSVDPEPNLGVGKNEIIDELLITWPDGKVTQMGNVKTNQTITLNWSDAEESSYAKKELATPIFRKAEASKVIDFSHQENTYVDFDRDRLTYHMRSNEGPKVAKADVNGDGLEDLYIGGAKGHAGQLYVQNVNGTFRKISQPDFEADKSSEDADAVFFDANGDGYPDLLVASGGNEFGVEAPELANRLYLNDGSGYFEKKEVPALSTNRWSTSTLNVIDLNGDGHLDFFAGSRLRPFLFGVPAPGFIFINDGKGGFTDQTKNHAPEFEALGMVTDAVWFDVDRDGDQELVVVGEWMYPKVFQNSGGQLKDISEKAGTKELSGWYNRIEVADLNQDGYLDIVLGNHGLNSRFRASQEKPLKMFVNDFDQNGSPEQIITRTINGRDVPLALKHELQMQLPSIKKKYLKYEAYNDQSIRDIFKPEQLEGAVVNRVEHLSTSILLNDGKGVFQLKVLPIEAQYAPVYAIKSADFNNDGNIDILLAGNLFLAKPQVGKYDANYGILLLGDGKGNFKAATKLENGLSLKGEARDFIFHEVNGQQMLLVLMNDAPIQAYEF